MEKGQAWKYAYEVVLSTTCVLIKNLAYAYEVVLLHKTFDGKIALQL